VSTLRIIYDSELIASISTESKTRAPGSAFARRPIACHLAQRAAHHGKVNAMRIRISTPLLALSVSLAALAMGCGGGEAAPDPKTPATAGGGSGKAVKEGDKAPALSIDSMNGTGKLAITPGKVTIVDFWATWCGPCQKSFPKLQDLYVKYKASGLEIVAVSVDEEGDKGKIPDFVKTAGAKFPVGWGGKKVGDEWKPENMPSTYIVGKDGVVKHVHRGYRDGEEVELEKELKAMF